jgi:hypothetical protein
MAKFPRFRVVRPRLASGVEFNGQESPALSSSIATGALDHRADPLYGSPHIFRRDAQAFRPIAHFVVGIKGEARALTIAAVLRNLCHAHADSRRLPAVAGFFCQISVDSHPARFAAPGRGACNDSGYGTYAEHPWFKRFRSCARASRQPALNAMFSLFKRSADPKSLTFKARVAMFWKWFADHASRFTAEIDGRRCAALQPTVSAKINELFPEFAWSFGPSAEASGHSFTLSGEGNPHRQLLAAFWLEQAPSFPGWTFHASKQPTRDLSSLRLEIGDRAFDPLAFWLIPQVDETRERIDLTVWHPAFAELEERLRWTIIFLYLDEVLGEIGTQNWIGQIEPGEDRLSDAMPLRELPSYIAKVAADYGWKKGNPGETWTSYHLENAAPGALRRDIIAGTTSQIVLIAEAENGHLDPDPLEGTGAEYLYVAFPASHLPAGDEVSARSRIEDALEAVLTSAGSGRVLGGAVGLEHAYVDLLIFDGATSVDLIETALRPLQLPAGTTLERFARAHASERKQL